MTSLPLLAALALLFPFPIGLGEASPASCQGVALPPEVVPLQDTGRRPGAAGSMTLLPTSSPFGISASPNGALSYELVVEVARLRRAPDEHYLVWIATSDLSEYRILGELPESGSIRGAAEWNKFMVFVSAESEAAPERWQGPILLRGLSPSSRMHTMAGHGPFEGLDCSMVF